MDYESADRWNQLHATGTPVRVDLVDGTHFEARTRSPARQWGNFAIVSLEGQAGMWTTSAMTAVPATRASPAAPDPGTPGRDIETAREAIAR